MFRKLATSGMIAAGLLCATLAAQPATAKDGRNGAFAAGAAAGVVGGALVGSAIRPSYGAAPVYQEEQVCHWQRERIYDEGIDAYRIRRVQICE